MPILVAQSFEYADPKFKKKRVFLKEREIFKKFFLNSEKTGNKKNRNFLNN